MGEGFAQWTRGVAIVCNKNGADDKSSSHAQLQNSTWSKSSLTHRMILVDTGIPRASHVQRFTGSQKPTGAVFAHSLGGPEGMKAWGC